MTHETRRLESVEGHRLAGVELAVIDCLLQALQADLGEVLGRNIVEAALGQAAVNRHLAAFEALDGHAGARLLALDALAGGLAAARADAATDAAAHLTRTLIVNNFVQ